MHVIPSYGSNKVSKQTRTYGQIRPEDGADQGHDSPQARYCPNILAYVSLLSYIQATSVQSVLYYNQCWTFDTSLDSIYILSTTHSRRNCMCVLHFSYVFATISKQGLRSYILTSHKKQHQLVTYCPITWEYPPISHIPPHHMENTPNQSHHATPQGKHLQSIIPCHTTRKAASLNCIT